MLRVIYQPDECKSDCDTCIQDMKEQCEFWKKQEKVYIGGV